MSRMVRYWRSFRAWLFMFMVFGSSFLGAIQILPCMLLIAIVSPAAQIWILNFLFGTWILFVATLCEYFLWIKVSVTGDRPHSKGTSFVIMNHRTRLDWLFYFCYHARFGDLRRLRISLKDMLRKIPGAGWAIDFMMFLFLRRRWEDDEPVVDAVLNYYREMDIRPQLVFFPDGTDLTEGSKRKSDAFAAKNNLPRYNYVLHPRTTGFSFVLKKLLQDVHFQDIWNISVAYPRNICQGEVDLVRGNIPQEVHFHTEIIPKENVSAREDRLGDLCCELWRKKERDLAYFYTEKYFPRGDTKYHSPGLLFRLTQLIAVVVWLCNTVFLIFLLVHSTSFQIYTVFVLCMFAVILVVIGGFRQVTISIQRFNSQIFGKAKDH